VMRCSHSARFLLPSPVDVIPYPPRRAPNRCQRDERPTCRRALHPKIDCSSAGPHPHSGHALSLLGQEGGGSTAASCSGGARAPVRMQAGHDGPTVRTSQGTAFRYLGLELVPGCSTTRGQLIAAGDPDGCMCCALLCRAVLYVLHVPCL